LSELAKLKFLPASFRKFQTAPYRMEGEDSSKKG